MRRNLSSSKINDIVSSDALKMRFERSFIVKNHFSVSFNTWKHETETVMNHKESAPTSESASQQAPPAPKQQDNVYYKNCSAVRAAGKAPIYRGQPGYASHLDRDGDGIACEWWGKIN